MAILNICNMWEVSVLQRDSQKKSSVGRYAAIALAVLLVAGVYIQQTVHREGSLAHDLVQHLQNARADLASNGYVFLEEDEVKEPAAESPGGDERNHALAEEILRLTNEESAKQGLPPLARHDALEHAAFDHSQEMRSLNYFSHTSPTAGKSTTRQRVNQYGVNPQMVAENIFECSGYQVQETAKYAVEAFMESPLHRKNVLNPEATHIGVGFVSQGGSVSVTQVFGAGL